MKMRFLGLPLACLVMLAGSVRADEADPIARFLGLYRASTNASDPALPAPAVWTRSPIALSVEREQDEIVLRLVGAGNEELVFVDRQSPFNLIVNTAGPDVASVGGFLRIDGDRVVAQRSEIGADGRQRHLRLLMRREGAFLQLAIFEGDGTKPLALVADRRLKPLPGK